MTPKLRLNDVERKVSLSCILKSRLLGIRRMRTSIHIMEAPSTHAAGVSISGFAKGLEKLYLCHLGRSLPNLAHHLRGP